MKKKKKIRLKKKTYALFLILITLLLLILKPNTTSKDNKKEEKPKTEQEIKLEKLDNIHKKIKYFHLDQLDRYLSYKEKNKKLSNIQIIKNVNMNLDLKWYESTEPAINKNTPLVLVNKHYYLENTDVPENLEEISSEYALSGMQLVKEAKEAFENLSNAARKENLKIIAMSSYRSYEYQVNLYNRYVQEDGQEKADTYSGRPGHSEHQTGYAVDVYNMTESYTNFEKTKEFEWMQKHAHEYGFILRFPKEKEQETGYQYESWHYRSVGKDVAKYIYNHDITFEEYYANFVEK